jgi:UDP:flavonoid glycosyltransferase YjiC (YdhE family)
MGTDDRAAAHLQRDHPSRGRRTALTAVAAGLPQLVLPNGADRYITGDAVRNRGNGLSAEPDELDAALVERLLTDRDLQVVADEVQTELAALPTPANVANRLTNTR